MKIAAILLSVPFGLANAGAIAQNAGDPMEKLRACSLLAQAERLECLDKLSRDITPPPRPAASPAPGVAPAADNWIVSETTSPRRLHAHRHRHRIVQRRTRRHHHAALDPVPRRPYGPRDR